MHEYVFGWATGGFRYEAIPLEVQAYALDARFRDTPFTPFAVQAAVSSAFPSSHPAV